MKETFTQSSQNNITTMKQFQKPLNMT